MLTRIKAESIDVARSSGGIAVEKEINKWEEMVAEHDHALYRVASRHGKFTAESWRDFRAEKKKEYDDLITGT